MKPIDCHEDDCTRHVIGVALAHAEKPPAEPSEPRRLGQNRRATKNRRLSPSKLEADRKAIRARQRALTRLGQMFPHEYEELCNEERLDEGLPPLGFAQPVWMTHNGGRPDQEKEG